MMIPTGITPQIQSPKPITFTARKEQNDKPVYIDHKTKSRMSLAALFGNIIGGQYLGGMAIRKILNNPKTAEDLLKVPMLRRAGAVGAGLALALATGFGLTKLAANWKKPEGEKLSNMAIFKVSLASLVGCAAGSLAGGLLAARIGDGIFAMLANAIVTVGGNDLAVNLAANNHNKKAAPPETQTFRIPQSMTGSDEFNYFLVRTKNN